MFRLTVVMLWLFVSGCHAQYGDDQLRSSVETPATLAVENRTIDDWWIYQDGPGAPRLLGEVRFASERRWRLLTGAGPTRIALVNVARRYDEPIVTSVFLPGSMCWRLVVDNAVRSEYRRPVVKEEPCGD